MAFDRRFFVLPRYPSLIKVRFDEKKKKKHKYQIKIVTA